jgi:hypothetical protein
MVGYWFADDPAGWGPSAELFSFLAAGEPPVLISLGAMSIGDRGAGEVADSSSTPFKRPACARSSRAGRRVSVS